MNGHISYGQDKIDYKIIVNPTLATKVKIHVHPNGTVEVEVPEQTEYEEIHSAVLKRSRWISKQVETTQQAHAYVLPREYISGETHFYLGRRHKLLVTETDKIPSKVALRRGRLEVTCRTADPLAIKRRLSTWYRERAEKYFEKRILIAVSTINWLDDVPGFKLVNMNKQWGSCSPQRLIHLNPNLIKAPSDCIDYVITHEICHIRERNHGRRYYELLERHYPQWRHVKTRLDGMAELLLAT